MNKLFFCFLIIFSESVFSQTYQDSNLIKRIELLEMKVEKLQKQIQKQKNNSLLPSNQGINSNFDGYKDKNNWRRLKKGMSEQEVISILGEPNKIHMSVSYSFWHYGFGRVDIDSSNSLSGWSEP